MNKEKKTAQASTEAKNEQTEEISIDSLEAVVGGKGLRSAPKEETTPISDDTRNKV